MFFAYNYPLFKELTMKGKKRRWFIIGAALVFLVLLGLVRQAWQKNLQNLSAPLKKGSIMECVYGVGTVASNKTMQVKSGIPSRIRSLFVKEGDWVEEGAKLVELETLFTAPFSGVVTGVSGSLGETVFPQTVLISLMDLKDRYVSVTLDQVGALKVLKGQRVKLNFDGLREKTFEGEVASIYPNNNHFLVHIRIQDLPWQILPGMSADVAIEISEHKDVLLIPVAALEKNLVLVKRNEDRLLPIQVSLGLIDGAMAEVAGGDLKEGDRLLLQTGVK